MSDTAYGDPLNVNGNSVVTAAGKVLQKLRYKRKYICIAGTVFTCDKNLFIIHHLKLQADYGGGYLTIVHKVKHFLCKYSPGNGRKCMAL